MISSQINFDKRQHEARIQQLENEIHYLQENLKSMEEIQGLTDLQLQEADEEKERILAQLQELEKKVVWNRHRGANETSDWAKLRTLLSHSPFLSSTPRCEDSELTSL